MWLLYNGFFPASLNYFQSPYESLEETFRIILTSSKESNHTMLSYAHAWMVKQCET
jgi:hypothetical protein